MAKAKLEVQVIGDASSLQRALRQSGSAADGFGSKMAKVGKLAAVGLGALATGAAFAGKRMISMASDAAEVQSKMEVVFGKTLPGLTKNLDKFAAATGASKFALREQVADMGALLEPLTANKKGAADLSEQFVILATDLGSFNNVPVADALLAIRSGLVGEAEPLRRFGVLLNEAAVNAEGVRMGLIKVGEKMTEQEKVQARANLIMQQTTLAQGDATHTAGSMANQMKRLRNNISDAATSLGTLLIPYALAAVKAFNDNWPAIEKVVKSVMKALASGVDAAVSALKRNFVAIKTIASTAFEGARAAGQKFASFMGTDLGQTLAIGAVALFAVSKALGAIAPAAKLANSALLILRGNPLWLALSPVALAVGNLTQRFIEDKLAAAQLADAMNIAAGSAGRLKGSLDALKGADLSVKEAKLAHTQATLRLAEAQANYTKVIQESGKGSAEAKAAYIGVKDAQLGLERSELNVTDAVKNQTKAHRDRNVELDRGRDKILQMRDAAAKANGTFGQSAAADKFADAMGKVAINAGATALKLKDIDPAGSRAAAKAALLAGVAKDLAEKLGRVPSRKEIIAEAKAVKFGPFYRELRKSVV